VSRLVRVERLCDGDRLFIVAGERGAIELREYPGYWTFYVHSPVYLPDVADRARSDVGRTEALPGLAFHGCYILEGDCWTGLIGCGGYDFDAPDVGEVVQWPVLEELYASHLGGGRG
jgi:hypothetical protein